MTRHGFEISEELKSPILLRTTTRLSHIRGKITLEKLKKPRKKGKFERSPQWVTVPAIARTQHPKLLKMLETAEKISERSQFNKIINVGKPKDWGIVTSGVAYNYVQEAAEDLKLNVRILKLGMTHPIPSFKILTFNFKTWNGVCHSKKDVY